MLAWRNGTARVCAMSLISGSLVSGCVSLRPTITSFSVDYNRVVADTRNRMILLNIVRAAYREPTYYTAFQTIEGSLNMQTAVGGTVANLAGGDATAFTPTVSGTLTNAPTFAIVPLNGDEFAKGMLQPVGPDTIQLFLSQGWRSKLLAPLLVQKVQCVYDGEVVAEIRNEPDSANQALLAKFEGIGFYTAKPEPNPTYKLTVKPADVLLAITGGALDKFEIEQHGPPGDPASTMVEIRAQAQGQLAASGAALFNDECKAQFDRDTEARPDQPQRANLTSAQVHGLAVSDTLNITGADARRSSAGKMALNIVFRSTDGIVYYLGERLRAQIKGRPVANADAEGDVLFHVDRDAPGPDAVAVLHRGQRWSIPAIEIGHEPRTGQGTPIIDRSLEVLALVNQLVAAQTSSKDFSRAPTSVRVR